MNFKEKEVDLIRGEFKKVLKETLDRLALEGKIVSEEEYKIGEVITLWDSFTEEKKEIWEYCNSTYPEIANTMRRVINLHNNKVFEMEEDNYSDLIDKPWWANESPRSTIIVDASIKVNRSLDYISMNIDIENDTRTDSK